MTFGDLTVRYLSFPLLLYLKLTGQVQFQVRFPLSTIFEFLLLVVMLPVGLGENCAHLWHVDTGRYCLTAFEPQDSSQKHKRVDKIVSQL